MSKQENETIRLNKYLAMCGVCSRREADRLIDEGKVSINGKAARMGQVVCEADVVCVDGKRVTGQEKKVVLAYYKPIGVTCSEKDEHAEKLVKDMIDYPIRVTYAGRLDRDSEGLLLLSNDGDLIQAMMKSSNNHEKEYVVSVYEKLTDEFLEKMRNGVFLEELNVTTKPCKVEQMGERKFRIILTQGFNRQIRRMCRAYDYHVRALKRVRVMSVTLAGLRQGEYRELNQKEMDKLYQACGIRRG